MASPLAQVLKQQFPNSHIVWAVQKESAAVLRHNPYIDELFIWDKAHWQDLWKQKKYKQLWSAVKLARKTLRNYKFDLALDLQGLLKSGFFTWISAARQRIGIGSREGSYWFMHKMVSRNVANREQMGADYRYLVNQMGWSDQNWELKVYNTDEAETRAIHLLTEYLEPGEPFAVICPFTTREQKLWPDEYWQQLILRIRGRYHMKTVILGAKHEGNRGQQLARRCGAINLAGRTELLEAISLMQKAAVIIGVDNGLTHCSQALPVPSIALFGPSCPYRHSGCENSRVLFMDLNCSPCKRRPSCGGSYDCMKELSPDLVLTEIKQLFKVQALILDD
ncbi:glycosyltransferase family 9 protein [Agaribacterium haliotis]|uniref:glycosyltransferase family 9 protein n=1 Tax=Agaribacterium haliotis TaxID=2013869 RepID=UPI0013043515|nr:glycosyltransferase family 9 protein [Agaribacterium haliotis]